MFHTFLKESYRESMGKLQILLTELLLEAVSEANCD